MFLLLKMRTLWIGRMSRCVSNETDVTWFGTASTGTLRASMQRTALLHTLKLHGSICCSARSMRPIAISDWIPLEHQNEMQRPASATPADCLAEYVFANHDPSTSLRGFRHSDVTLWPIAFSRPIKRCSQHKGSGKSQCPLQLHDIFCLSCEL